MRFSCHESSAFSDTKFSHAYARDSRCRSKYRTVSYVDACRTPEMATKNTDFTDSGIKFSIFEPNLLRNGFSGKHAEIFLDGNLNDSSKNRINEASRFDRNSGHRVAC